MKYQHRSFPVTIVHATRFIYFLVLAAFCFIVDAKENYHRQLTKRELTQVFGVQNHNEGRILVNHFIDIRKGGSIMIFLSVVLKKELKNRLCLVSKDLHWIELLQRFWHCLISAKYFRLFNLVKGVGQYLKISYSHNFARF